MMEVWCKIKSWSQFLKLPNGGSSGQVFGLSVISSPQRIGLTLVAKTLRQKKRGCFNRRVTDWATAEFLLLKK